MTFCHHGRKDRKRHGFTLVELSIVLVILGLLIGGVLTGQSLIRASELRSVMTQQQRIFTAVHTFRDKYFALPGDMPNATAYWGAQHATPATCATTASTTALTCNGNGNGVVDIQTNSIEVFRFWQQMANAGLIEGSYIGINAGGSNFYATNNTNAPSGKISSSLWYVGSFGQSTGQFIMFDGTYDNVFVFAGLLVNGYPNTPIFKPQEAYNIDMKTDDGKPATGKIVALALVGSGLQFCTDTMDTTNYSANYLLNSNSTACSIIYKQAF